MEMERRRPAGWPGGVLAARRTQARDACGPAGEDAGAPKTGIPSYLGMNVTFAGDYTKDPPE